MLNKALQILNVLNQFTVYYLRINIFDKLIQFFLSVLFEIIYRDKVQNTFFQTRGQMAL